jgi:hypothetical protein
MVHAATNEQAVTFLAASRPVDELCFEKRPFARTVSWSQGMAVDVSQFVLRDPRYIIAEGNEVPVEVRRIDGRQPQVVRGTLADFSRKGMQLRSDTSLEIGEVVSATLHDGKLSFQIELEGTVQWQRQSADGDYAIGLKFAEDVNWEVLGELFLSGILDQSTAV